MKKENITIVQIRIWRKGRYFSISRKTSDFLIKMSVVNPVKEQLSEMSKEIFEKVFEPKEVN